MSMNNVRHMTYICHLQTLNHTYKHNLAPHAGFPNDSGPPTVIHPQNPRSGGGADLPLWLSPYEDGPMDFFIYLCLFSTYVHGKPRLNTFHHIIHTGRPVPGVSTYGSTILLSVCPCP